MAGAIEDAVGGEIYVVTGAPKEEYKGGEKFDIKA